jgi:L-threonylcarbamoyladenylate synthase
VLDCLGDKIEYLLDGGPCEVGLESTIVDLRRETVPRLLRPGVITPEMLAETLGAPLATEGGDTDNPSIPEISAPGQMPKHYSPSTPLSLFPAGGVPQENLAGNTALVFLKKPSRPFDSLAVQNIFWLTEQGDLPTAARNLFPLLHTLDAKGFEHIAVEKAPAPGIGLAINDRLTRAARR